MTEETHGSRELCVTGAGQAPAARQVRCKLLQEAANVVLIVHQSQKIETCPMISGNRPGSIDFAKRRSGAPGSRAARSLLHTRPGLSLPRTILDAHCHNSIDRWNALYYKVFSVSSKGGRPYM